MTDSRETVGNNERLYLPCEVCGIKVKAKNLASHERRVHGAMSVEELFAWLNNVTEEQSEVIHAHVERLAAFIEALPGNKIVTLVSDSDDSFKIDVGADGTWGHHESHRLVFDAKVGQAVHERGGLVVRQFLEATAVAPESVDKCPHCGEKASGNHGHAGRALPMKVLYSFSLGEDRIEGISAKDNESAQNTDPRTGNPLPKEFGVVYADSMDVLK